METEKIEEKLEIRIKRTELFQEAFTHRSYLNEHGDYSLPSNERLEFLGDAILQFLTSEHLFQKFQKLPEGEMTNIRAALVCTRSLAEESKRLNYGDFLLLSKGEESSGGRSREYILANTFEAALGAIYLNENDLETCRKFLITNLFYKAKEIVESGDFKDFKSNFQELTQEKVGITPTYKVLEEWGPDHDKIFKVGVFTEKKLEGEGSGQSKQEAEQAAAKEALRKWGRF